MPKNFVMIILLGAWAIVSTGMCLAAEKGGSKPVASGIGVDRRHWGAPATKYINVISPLGAYAPNKNSPGYGDLIEITTTVIGGDTFGSVLMRRSTDNGRTWQPGRELDILHRSVVVEADRSRLRILANFLFVDETNGMMVLFVNYYVWPGPDGLKKRKVMLFYSNDNAFTWDGPHQVIQQGKDRAGRPFDDNHWMEYATYGKNMAASGQVPIIQLKGVGPRQGQLVLPLYIQRLTDSGELYTPTWYFLECATMLGRWQDGRLRWKGISNKVGVTHRQSDRGVYEATVAELRDGRCLMVMRMSNHGGKVKGCKMFSVSEDQCQTWSAPKPLLYDDGSWMYSSASNSTLLQHSSGRVFYCGIITQANTNSNAPRYPMCIAEIDQTSLTVRKASVKVVVTRRPEEPASIQYANQGIYEDRESTNLIVLVSPWPNPQKLVEKYEVPISLFDR